MQSTTDYKLRVKGKWTYSSDGERVTANFITLSEPDYSNPENYYKLQDMISVAQANLLKIIDTAQINEMKENMPGLVEKQKAFHEIDREKDLLEQIEGLKMGLRTAQKTPDFIKIFKNMVLKSRGTNPCMVDNKEPITEAIFSKMHPSDVEGMALRWAAFFILALEEEENKSSEKATESLTKVKEL